MLGYILKRLLGVFPTLFIISIIIFGMLELAPGDAALALIPPDLAGEGVEELRAQLGLDAPVHKRYLGWLTEALKGNLGYSFSTREPVIDMIARRLPATMELVLVAFFFSVIIGIGFGVWGALHQYKPSDHTLTFLGMIGISIPEFFFGILAIYIFAIILPWFPVGGRSPLGDSGFLERLRHLVLPSTVLAITMVSALMRYTRASMLEVLHQPYLTTAFSKGLPRTYVYIVHAFRNAAIPVMIVLMFRILILFGGVVFIEQVFSWPGMGKLMLTAASNRDYPVILGCLMMITTMVIFISILVDVMTAWVDPRVRLQ